MWQEKAGLQGQCVTHKGPGGKGWTVNWRDTGANCRRCTETMEAGRNRASCRGCRGKRSWTRGLSSITVARPASGQVVHPARPAKLMWAMLLRKRTYALQQI
jgi:hypothetical protein